MSEGLLSPIFTITNIRKSFQNPDARKPSEPVAGAIYGGENGLQFRVSSAQSGRPPFGNRIGGSVKRFLKVIESVVTILLVQTTVICNRKGKTNNLVTKSTAEAKSRAKFSKISSIRGTGFQNRSIYFRRYFFLQV